MATVTMKCFIILAIFLAIAVHTIISQETGGDGTDSSGTGNDNSTAQQPEDMPVETGNGNSSNGDSGNAPGTGNSGGNATAPESGTSGDNSSTTETTSKKVSNIIDGLPAKCSNRYTACYGPDSTESDLKNTDLAAVSEDDICEVIEDGEDCVTSILETFVCTEEEYEKVRKEACSAPHSAVLSVTLIGVLCLISNLLSQH